MACQSVAHGCGRTILLSPIPKKTPEMPLRVFGLFPLARSVWQAAPGAEPTMNASYRKNNRSEQASMQSGGLRQGEDDDE